MFVKTSVFVTDKRKALACDKIWPFFVHYKSVKFYSTGPKFRGNEFLNEKLKLKGGREMG